MTGDGIIECLRRTHGDAIVAGDAEAAEPWAGCEPAAVAEVAATLRDAPELRCDCLSNVSGVDLAADERIAVVYHLFSYPLRHAFVLKAEVPRAQPSLPSVAGIWPAANWLEREVYDLLGVAFSGHPDLRRIMLPEDWVGHPLRKDYVEQEHYHGISTRRESLLR